MTPTIAGRLIIFSASVAGGLHHHQHGSTGSLREQDPLHGPASPIEKIGRPTAHDIDRRDHSSPHLRGTFDKHVFKNPALIGDQGSILPRGPLTCCVATGVRDATGELARFLAPFFSVLPDLPVTRNDAHQTHSLAPGVATGPGGRAGRRPAGSRLRKADW
jgi:hypothetical protein